MTPRTSTLDKGLKSCVSRAIGVELRIYGCDPDVAEANARVAIPSVHLI